MSDRELFARYPFLPGAETLVDELGLTVADLIASPMYGLARETGRARVRASVDDPTAAPAAEEVARLSEELRYLSFLYARLLVAASRAPGTSRRWAVAEAKGASASVRSGGAEMIREIGYRLGYEFDGDERELRCSVPTYLRLATPIREAEFRLVQQPVADGRVGLPPARAARLLQEAIRLQLSEAWPVDEKVRRTLRSGEAEFFSEIADRIPAPVGIDRGLGPLTPARFPPCIRKMRRTLEAGENLSHSGRFALAAFLHKVGADAETIVDAFRGAPDFDEGVTRYQVDHISRRDDGRGYEPPTCDTLRTHGLCARDGDPTAKAAADRERDARCFDPALRHPVQYYRWAGAGGVRSPASASPAAASGTPRGPAPGPSPARR